MTKPQIPNDVYDVVIVGGGPAGLTAGLYAARATLKVLLIEGAASASQITVTDMIENYPGFPGGIGGFELVETFKRQAAQFGMETTSADVKALSAKHWADMKGWEVATSSGNYNALAVIIATGAQWRKLGVPGEEAYIGKGVSNCATCDGPFYRNRDVVVVGGGDTAIQEAIFLTNFAKKVFVVHRRDRLRATGILQKRAFGNEKIAFVWNAVVEEITGGPFVETVRVRDVKAPEKFTNIPAEGIFIFIGLTPNTDLVRGVCDLDKQGYILTDPGMRTTAAGIFACGDCIQKLLRQVITACGDGATAAHAAQLYIEDLKGEAY
ncbi:MAG: thioredoxin-disulfide reductase [Deltaproteobacteria bacterium]|nr:thioredoxin-disulfide reductase [Deltaproteobacteria bacterium]